MSLPVRRNIQKGGFRLRGMEMSRIDGFSDGVFGFALTLFVVSLEVPKNCTELYASLRGFLSICHLFLVDARPAGQADFCAQACEVAPLNW